VIRLRTSGIFILFLNVNIKSGHHIGHLMEPVAISGTTKHHLSCLSPTKRYPQWVALGVVMVE